MFEANFFYDGRETKIQCNKKDKMKNIFQNFANKTQINDINSIYFLYGGKNLNDGELTLEEVTNNLDKKSNKVKIIANDINFSSLIKKFEISKEIICPKCMESAQIEIKDYKFSIYDYQNNHKITDILFDEFENTQKLDLSKIQCNICKNEKSHTSNNEFYRCNSCDINLCILCKLKHNKEHNIINYKQKNYICKFHAHPYSLYCNTCKKNICIICEKNHNNHDILSFGKEIDNIEKLKSQNDKLRNTLDIFKNNIEDIKNILDKIVLELEEYYKIQENIINNFTDKELNYEILHNIKIFSQNKIQSDLNEIISKDDIEDKFHNIYKIYSEMISKNENNQKKDKIKEQNENDNDIQQNVIKDLNALKDNRTNTNHFGNDNKNDSNHYNSSSNNNDNSIKESIRQNEKISLEKDIFEGNLCSNQGDIAINKINEMEQNKTYLSSGNNSDSYNNDKNQDKINENEEKNKNDINNNKINEIKNNNEIKEFKDIYSNINEEKINIIFIMPNNEKKGFKIPSNFTKKEIYFTAYNLCDYQKGEFEYISLLILFYNGNILNNDDSIEKFKNNDEIEIKQHSIISYLDFSDLIKEGKSQIKKTVSFLDSFNQGIRVDLPDDITVIEIIEHINSIYNNLLDSNRVICELYFKNKLKKKKNKHIGEVHRFRKLKDINITIKLINKVCLQKKPGRIFKVKIFDDENKPISEIPFGTLEKIKNFYEDFKDELTKKNIIDYGPPSFEKEGKDLDLNKGDEKTFFSINVKSDFNCFLNSIERRKSYFLGYNYKINI